MHFDGFGELHAVDEHVPVDPRVLPSLLIDPGAGLSSHFHVTYERERPDFSARHASSSQLSFKPTQVPSRKRGRY